MEGRESEETPATNETGTDNKLVIINLHGALLRLLAPKVFCCLRCLKGGSARPRQECFSGSDTISHGVRGVKQ